jgi:hypothetical protein
MPEYEARHRQEWTRVMEGVSAALQQFVWRVVQDYLAVVTYERQGVATALDTGARRVTVDLLPVGGSGAGTPQSARVRAYYGRPAWTASAIVGRPVRVWERVERRLGPTGPVRTTTTYTVDDVTSGSA